MSGGQLPALMYPDSLTHALPFPRSPSPIPVVRKRISAPPATEERRYTSSSSAGAAGAMSLSRWERERDRHDRESRSSGTYTSSDHRDDIRGGRRHAVASRLGPYKRTSY